jgi:Homodimerisation domain of SGTA
MISFSEAAEFSDDNSESIEVAIDCLRRAFVLNSSSTDEAVPEGLLLDLFSSWKTKQLEKLTSGSGADLVRDKTYIYRFINLITFSLSSFDR